MARSRVRSVLTGTHALFRKTFNAETAPAARTILQDVFVHGNTQELNDRSLDTVTAAAVHENATNTIIVPVNQTKLPVHLLPYNKAQPWELLPLRVAALNQYPNLFGDACMFFAGIQKAVHTCRHHVSIPCTKVTLDLAKLLRNLGILQNFSITQNLSRCGSSDYVWPPGKEPEHYTDLMLHPHLKLRLELRWDALKPLWQGAATSAAQQQISTTDGLPFAVRHLSTPSQPRLVRPGGGHVSLTANLPPGLVIMYHHQLGLTTDTVVDHYGVPALALAHLALPWVQIAQVQAGLQDKIRGEAGKHMYDTVPLTKWRLQDWVATTLNSRAQQVEKSLAASNEVLQNMLKDVERANKQDKDKALASLSAGHKLDQDITALELLSKLQEHAGRGNLLPSPGTESSSSSSSRAGQQLSPTSQDGQARGGNGLPGASMLQSRMQAASQQMPAASSRAAAQAGDKSGTSTTSTRPGLFSKMMAGGSRSAAGQQQPQQKAGAQQQQADSGGRSSATGRAAASGPMPRFMKKSSSSHQQKAGAVKGESGRATTQYPLPVEQSSKPPSQRRRVEDTAADESEDK